MGKKKSQGPKMDGEVALAVVDLRYRLSRAEVVDKIAELQEKLETMDRLHAKLDVEVTNWRKSGRPSK